MANAPRLHTLTRLVSGAAVPATPGQAHYLGNVMRLSAGDAVRLFNAEDGEWDACIDSQRRDHAIFLVGAQTRAPAPEPDLWLVFSPLKRDATDLVVQKATELGVSVLQPVFCERTNTARVNAERLAAIATEAAEQSERLSVPAIRDPVRLFDLLALWPKGRLLAAAIERAGPSIAPDNAGALLIGPEGGFSPRELDVLGKTSFITPVSLGPRILRADTACIAGLALLQAATWSHAPAHP